MSQSSKHSASLKDKVAIVTGAGGGLGREYALLLASYGAKVIVNDYGGSLDGQRGEISRAESVVQEIQKAGGQAIADGHDVSIQDEVNAMIKVALQSFGAIHILVNNAGIAGQHSAHDDLNVTSFRRTWEIAALGTMLTISAVYPIMQRQAYGRIINTSSDSIYGLGAGGDTGYASSKGAVFATTKELGRFSPQHGIKINGVLPSAVSRMSDLSPTIKRITRTYFKTESVAYFVAALASEGCPVSGELFSVGGGRAARTTLATFPGHTREESIDGYLENFEAVMGSDDKVYVPKDCLDQVAYSITQATGVDPGTLSLD